MSVSQPEAYIDFEVYEDSTNLIGIAKATLPDIVYMSTSMTGAGVAGTIDTPLSGMIESMTLGLEFRDALVEAVKLGAPKKHNIELRAVEQYWNEGQELKADKYTMVVSPKSIKLGSVAPASSADASGEYFVYYLKAFRGDSEMMEIDPFNQKCVINGTDYCADLRKALGKT